jgi:hypothetical protein
VVSLKVNAAVDRRTKELRDLVTLAILMVAAREG